MDSQERAYISSDHPVKSIHCEATIELGKKLTKELGFDQSVDTLGRWMAHYIAELIEDAEKATGDDKTAKQKACCEAIIKVWKHSYAFQYNKYPFADLEPVLRALDSLDPENDTPRYFKQARESYYVADENDGTKKWIDFANDIDQSAKIVISFCLDQAAQSVVDKSAAWVKLAKDAGVDQGVEFLIFDDLILRAEPVDVEKNLIMNRIEHLERFAKTATEVAVTWRSSL